MLLDIYVQPRAKKTEFGGLHGGAVKIRVKAPPRWTVLPTRS